MPLLSLTEEHELKDWVSDFNLALVVLACPSRNVCHDLRCPRGARRLHNV